MSADVRIDLAAQFVGKKAFKQADDAVAKLQKSVKSLASGLGIAFGARAVGLYAKNAVKAFAEDEKAARSLTLTLNNLGMAFADPEVKSFISTLESQYGVLDDLLRPAYQKLLTTTGDYKKAQDLLKTSLDLAAMSGSDVVTVAGDLSKAFAGSTRGLQKYGLGLSKTELAAMSFEDILKQIAIVSEGQAQSAADSYSGSLDRLNVAAANASESIGKDLLTALDTLAGGNGLPKTITLIESLSSGIGDAVIGFSRLIRNIGILASGNPLESIRDLQKATAADRLADMKERATYGGIYAEQYKKEAAAAAKILVTTKKITKETAAQLAAKKLAAAIDKANLALAKGQDVFDLDKIQIAAALTNQAELLGKATTASQVLQIANDTARLNVKRDILALEDAIASKDTAAINAATAKLNEDMKILGALTGQSIKLTDIKSILDSLTPKDLINQANLDEALAKIKAMLALLAQMGAASSTAGKAAPSTSGLTPANTIAGTNLNVAALGGVITQIQPNLKEYTPSGMSSGIGSNLKEYNYNVSVYANTVANPDELTGLIQDTIIRLNKQGDYLTTAGAL